MVPGINFSKVNDVDTGQLHSENVGQANDTEQISMDIQQFEQQHRKESLHSSHPLFLRISSKKKNDRARDSEDPEATPRKKKSKNDEDNVIQDEIMKVRKMATNGATTIMKCLLCHQFSQQKEVLRRYQL